MKLILNPKNRALIDINFFPSVAAYACAARGSVENMCNAICTTLTNTIKDTITPKAAEALEYYIEEVIRAPMAAGKLIEPCCDDKQIVEAMMRHGVYIHIEQNIIGRVSVDVEGTSAAVFHALIFLYYNTLADSAKYGKDKEQQVDPEAFKELLKLITILYLDLGKKRSTKG